MPTTAELTPARRPARLVRRSENSDHQPDRQETTKARPKAAVVALDLTPNQAQGVASCLIYKGITFCCSPQPATLVRIEVPSRHAQALIDAAEYV